MSIHAPLDFQGVKHTPSTPTVDKTMHDRNHLTAAEIDTLMAATKGSRRAARDHRGLSCELVPARVMPEGQ